MFFASKLKVTTDETKIKSLLTRGVEEIFVRESLEAKLKSGKRLRVKLGFDPTGSKIHIGRAIVMRKLREFQDLGHTIIFIVGDFTALIGDPSDKLEKRPMLTEETVKQNLKTYKQQLAKIIDIERAEFQFNSRWLSKLSFKEIAALAESFSVPQMSARRNFKERLEHGGEVSLREFLYPLMQGYDSVAVKADVELGGFDQLFNLKAGRVIQKHYGQTEQDVLTTKMLPGTDGRKMSTSWGNVITIVDEPADMFGKVMALRDELILEYFLLCTNTTESEIKKIEERLKAGDNPKDIKMNLAFEIVKLYHSEKEALKARQSFTKTFSEGAIPEDVQTVEVKKDTPLVELLLVNQIVSSKSEFRRLVEGRSVTLLETNTEILEPDYRVTGEGTFKIGKRRFLKVKVSS